MTNYTLVLQSKYPNTKWAIYGETYNGLEWYETSTKPTKQELDALWPTVQYEMECAQVEQNRLIAYEQTSDPIYFKWQRGDATEAEWREAVAKVKTDNPYPPAP
jgi:hypothetical protein